MRTLGTEPTLLATVALKVDTRVVVARVGT
jgi:hypothetical protein